MASSKRSCKWYEEDCYITSAKRVWGVVCLLAGVFLVCISVGVVLFGSRVVDITGLGGFISPLFLTGGGLLGVGVVSDFAHRGDSKKESSEGSE
jgi:hypothetical protein